MPGHIKATWIKIQSRRNSQRTKWLTSLRAGSRLRGGYLGVILRHF